MGAFALYFQGLSGWEKSVFFWCLVFCSSSFLIILVFASLLRRWKGQPAWYYRLSYEEKRLKLLWTFLPAVALGFLLVIQILPKSRSQNVATRSTQRNTEPNQPIITSGVELKQTQFKRGQL